MPFSTLPHEFLPFGEGPSGLCGPEEDGVASRPHSRLPQDHEERRLGGLSILLPRFRGTWPRHPHEDRKKDGSSTPRPVTPRGTLVRCPRINWTGIGWLGGADPLVRAGRLVPLLEPRCQPPRRHGQADGGVGRGPGGPPYKRLQSLSSCFRDTTLASVPALGGCQRSDRGQRELSWRRHPAIRRTGSSPVNSPLPPGHRL